MYPYPPTMNITPDEYPEHFLDRLSAHRFEPTTAAEIAWVDFDFGNGHYLLQVYDAPCAYLVDDEQITQIPYTPAVRANEHPTVLSAIALFRKEPFTADDVDILAATTQEDDSVTYLVYPVNEEKSEQFYAVTSELDVTEHYLSDDGQNIL